MEPDEGFDTEDAQLLSFALEADNGADNTFATDETTTVNLAQSSSTSSSSSMGVMGGGALILVASMLLSAIAPVI